MSQPARGKAEAKRGRIKPSLSYIAFQNNLEGYLSIPHRAENS